jgi:hypothetical protein
MSPALTASYTSVQNGMRGQPVRGTDLTKPVSGASDVRLWFAVETLGKPLHATIVGAAAACCTVTEQAAAESFNLRLICFKADLWVFAESITLRPTRGPRYDGKAASWMGRLHAAA